MIKQRDYSANITDLSSLLCLVLLIGYQNANILVLTATGIILTDSVIFLKNMMFNNIWVHPAIMCYSPHLPQKRYYFGTLVIQP